MTAVILQDLSVCYAQKTVLFPLNHHFVSGQWHVILGRSGAGKTTLLNAIGGFLPAQATVQGKVRAEDGQPLAHRLALMAQENDLLPWLSARENVLLGARLRGQSPQTKEAERLLELCELSGHRNKRPAALSGGQRQRVALARTLLENQPLVLMDEPFSALDAVTRFTLQTLASRLLAGKTVLMITHDPAEALRLADHLYILDETLQEMSLPTGNPPRTLDSEGFAQAQQALLEALHA